MDSSILGSILGFPCLGRLPHFGYILIVIMIVIIEMVVIVIIILS